jgi:hypothetical protein
MIEIGFVRGVRLRITGAIDAAAVSATISALAAGRTDLR